MLKPNRVKTSSFQVINFDEQILTNMKKERVYALVFASVYPLYIKKAEAKGRTKAEVHYYFLANRIR